MQRKTLLALGLALALLPVLPAVQASHSGFYAFTPVEHDDQGRSNEPDLARTGVLGTLVENKVIDLDLDGIAAPDSALPTPGAGQNKFLAPGCTDDSGRRPSGLCGLYTVGLGTANTGKIPGSSGVVGVQGMGGNAAPGAYTPTKATQVRYLDSLVHIQVNSAGSAYIEVNKKVQDTGGKTVLQSVDSRLGGDALIGSAALWPFYGKWQDKNGNGVVDHLGGTAEAPSPSTNEFVWYGNCLAFGGAENPLSIVNGYCAKETNPNGGGKTVMHGFLFPGNHHALCGGAAVGPECAAHPGDLPARQVLHFMGANGVPPGLFFTPGDIRTFDQFDEQFLGDPLLGPQGSVKPDMQFDDRSGDPNIGTRQWVYGLGWATWFYDSSVLSSTVIVTAVNCADDSSSANTVRLGTCTSTDVDNYAAWSPATESLLAGTVKPAARSNWVFARDSWIPFQTYADSHVNSRTLYDAQAGDAQGRLDDQTQETGFSREPNAAGDSFPGAVRGTCASSEATHNGFCNSYAGYRLSAQGWTDIQPARSGYYNRPVTVLGSACTLCVAGPGVDVPFAGDTIAGGKAVRDAEDHRRTLGPGQYYFVGVMGRWQDRTQTWDEQLFDPLTQQTVTNPYVNGADGWVGNVVNATGAFYYRGYADTTCTTDNGAGTHTYAECNPYRAGNVQDPQQAGATSHGEWNGDCDSTRMSKLRIEPAGGVWTVPVFVWRDHEQGMHVGNQEGIPGVSPGTLDDFTGRGAIELVIACREGVAKTSGVYLSADYLVLPLGNVDQGVTTRFTANVGGVSSVTDVDTYVAWGRPASA